MEMEKDASNSSDPKSSSGSTTTFSTSPSPSRVAVHSPPPVRSSSTTHSQKHQFSTNFTKLYHSIFSPTSPSKKSTPVSPQKVLYLQQSSPDKSASSSDSHQNSSGICSNSSTTADADQKLEHACLVLEYQNLQNRYNLCRSHLQDLTNEINALRRENTSLRLAKTELVKLLSLSSQATMHDCLRRLSHLDLDSGSDFAGDDGYSPTSVVEQNRLERTEPDRVWLPKSISVRSSSYLKANQLAANNSGPSRTAQLRASSELETGKQRMYLPGAKKEFEVYSQGMFKTELCNKWQESGTCPYGDHCQFAHGIAELRPVIRHPRYKTEVCRMVLAGDSCPYGHRCHFRHSLTEQEMMLATPR